MKTFGASWNEIGRDWTAMAEEVNQAARDRRSFTLIDFAADGSIAYRMTINAN